MARRPSSSHATDEDTCGNFDVSEALWKALFGEEQSDRAAENDVPSNRVRHPSSATALNSQEPKVAIWDVRVLVEDIRHSASFKLKETVQTINETVTQGDQVSVSNDFTLSKMVGVDLDEVPPYLWNTNPTFERMMRAISPISLSAATVAAQALRSIAILMSKILSLDIIRTLWITYRQSGMGELPTTFSAHGFNEKIWPKSIRSLVNQYQLKGPTTQGDDQICLILVNDCLRQLDDKDEQYRRELRVQTSQLTDYSPAIEQSIERFVQQELTCLRIEVDCHKALVQFDYVDELLQQQYSAQNPTARQIDLVQRLCQGHYDQETCKHEFDLLRDQLPVQLSAHPFDSQSIALSPCINCLPTPSLQLQLYQQHQIISEQTRMKTLHVYMKSVEDQLAHCQKQFRLAMDEMWKVDRSRPDHPPFTSTMVNLIDQRLSNITARIDCIYKHKNELFRAKLNTYS